MPLSPRQRIRLGWLPRSRSFEPIMRLEGEMNGIEKVGALAFRYLTTAVLTGSNSGRVDCAPLAVIVWYSTQARIPARRR
jgi:hypothetical protein